MDTIPSFGGLPPAPGAKAAKTCGILAIILGLTCIGIPVAIVLGIVAIVQANKAKKEAQAHPDLYAQPGNAGLVLGIIGTAMPVVMLPFVGIASAVAIPALLAQRGRAQEMAVRSEVAMLASKVSVEAAQQKVDAGQSDPEAVIKRVLAQHEAFLDPYTHKTFPLEAAEQPSAPGHFAISQGYAGNWAEGRPSASIIVRGAYRHNGQVEVEEKTVELD